MRRFATALAACLLLSSSVFAQEAVMDAGALAHALDRLGKTGRVLYVAAHPDDENTRLLTYLVNARHLEAAYLSMTRGGGGQNLIGREQDELMDAMRTQELLAARALDGATQRFSRMRDFGYSKSAKETLAIWGHDAALSDVVWVIRSFQPDVIITRFDENPPNHGHHTASAQLAREAFVAAADPTRFPEQLTLGVTVWQANRLLHNVPHWKKEPLPEGALSLDVGGYDPRLGLSYGELAARSRTQHKSQGFGVQGERGELLESFVPVAGVRPRADLFDGLDFSWKRYGAAGAAWEKALASARKSLHRDFPERALPALLEAHRALSLLPDDVRARDARRQLLRVIAGVSGLFLRATAARPMASPGETVRMNVEVVLGRPVTAQLGGVRFPDGKRLEAPEPLAVGKKRELSRDVQLAADAPVSTPYWLAEPSLSGRQVLREPRLLGEPEGPAPQRVSVELRIAGELLMFELPVVYSWNDRVHGERVRTFQIAPPATVTPEREAVMLVNGSASDVVLRVRASKDAVDGNVRLVLPKGFRAKPAAQPVKLALAGDETTVTFSVSATATAPDSVELVPVIEVGGKEHAFREDVIDYPHIPMQVVLRPAKLRAVKLVSKIPKGVVGYIEGSGDSVASDLAHIGLRVEALDDATLRAGVLSRFAAIVVGIRAYNTRASLRSAHAALMRYVEQGGTLVVQYNTHSGFSPLTLPVGPYPLELGRERVTDETAELTALEPKHPLLTRPNRITEADFAGWVQERGLYFASKWDARYLPLFEAGDPGEPRSKGSLLVAKHGKGRYVYTGLSFFRQLPAGVPGAYRLLVNLLAR